MAEFVDVFRQFSRMCKANVGCFNCPLNNSDSVSDECTVDAFAKDPERIEREVMKWAAEHPEPVYPTWVEWFRQIGVVEPTQKCFHDWLLKPIPADIAQKLGITPKEK